MYQYHGRVLRIVDGDTVDLDIDLGCSIHIHERCRLYGINTPETYGVAKNGDEYQRGMAAKEFLQTLVEGELLVVKTIKDKKGKYGRYLVELFLMSGEAVSVNQMLVDNGHAVPYFGGKR